MTWIDYLILSAAWILLVCGFAILPWALFRDRACGRRRCPKCWYDMQGVDSSTCPECGRTQKREKRFVRTRRRWRLAALGVLIMLCSGAVFAWQHVRQVGWVEATPTWVYIALLPKLDSTTTMPELQRRVYGGELRQWEYRILLRRSIDVLDSDAESEAIQASLHFVGFMARADWRRRTSPWKQWPDESSLEFEGVAAPLIRFVRHEDAQIRISAMRTICELEDLAVEALPAVIGALRDDDTTVQESSARELVFYHKGLSKPHFTDFHGFTRRDNPNVRSSFSDPSDYEARIEFLDALRQCGEDTEQAIAILRRGLTSSDIRVRRVSIWALARMRPDNQAICDEVLDLFNDENDRVGRTVVESLSVFPITDHTHEVLAAALGSDDFNIRIVSFNIVASRQEYSDAFREQVRRALSDPDHTMRHEAIRAWIEISNEREPAILSLLQDVQELSDRQPFFVERVLRLIVRRDLYDSRFCTHIEKFLDAEDTERRSMAALILAHCELDSETATRTILEACREEQQVTGRPPTVNSLMFLYDLASTGRYSLEVLDEQLQDSNPLRRSTAIRLAEEAWKGGSPVLKRLRRMRNDPVASVANEADMAIWRIEWYIEHPEDLPEDRF